MSNTIKVLQVFGSLNMGGAESRMMDIYRHLDRESCSFDFLTLTNDKQYFEEEITKLGGKIYKVSSPRECGLIKHLQMLRKCIKAGNYDAVHAHTSYHIGIVMLAAWLEKVPIRIAHSRTTGTKSKSPLKKLYLLFGRKLITLFSTDLFAISKDAGNYLFGNHRYIVIPNAIDLEKYNEITEDKRKEIIQELKIPNEAFVIGQIGRFDSMKNHQFTINWFKQYLKKEPNAFLVLIGDGTLKNSMENLVNEYNIQNRVCFTGVRSDVPQLLHVIDVLFFPSKFEGLGGVSLEAQAVGIPVVESDSIPQESDIGLGLVSRLSLSEDMECWNKAIDKSKYILSPSISEINKAFTYSGYSIYETLKKYMIVYERELKK